MIKLSNLILIKLSNFNFFQSFTASFAIRFSDIKLNKDELVAEVKVALMSNKVSTYPYFVNTTS